MKVNQQQPLEGFVLRIDEIELFRVAMPMKEPWRTSFSEEVAIDSIFVRMRSEGQDSWGETAPYRLPQFSPEWAPGAFALLRDAFAPALVGQSIESGVALADRLRQFKGNQFAKAGLDNAWWDLQAKLCNEPLWKVIGGDSPNVSVGADIAVMDDLDQLVRAVEQAVEAEFRRVKLKFRHGWGVEMVARVREACPDAVLHVDCNSGFTLNDMAMFKELDRFNLAMIEQPLAYDDLIDHARLQQELQTPICLDESITSLDRARKAISIGACGWINLKPSRVGGLTEAIAIHDYCAEKDIPCWVGGMLESAVGQGPAIALSTLANIKYPCDIFPSERLYQQDVSEPDIVLSGKSQIVAPSAPGHGFSPNMQRLQKCTLERALVSRK
ncbi:MAG: o-succinylbenzoate synthase [Mesorhizobium sp.]